MDLWEAIATSTADSANADQESMASSVTDASPAIGISPIANAVSATEMLKTVTRKTVLVSTAKVTQQERHAKGKFNRFCFEGYILHLFSSTLVPLLYEASQ